MATNDQVSVQRINSIGIGVQPLLQIQNIIMIINSTGVWIINDNPVRLKKINNTHTCQIFIGPCANFAWFTFFFTC